MIVYPTDNYNSFISLGDANLYFGNRLYSDEFFNADDREVALITAFRSLNELDITIDPTVAAELQAVKDAQCEQALYELKMDLDQQFDSLAIPDLKVTKKEMPRYSERALAILRPYMSARTVTVTR
jgi:hypothetical protein